MDRWLKQSLIRGDLIRKGIHLGGEIWALNQGLKTYILEKRGDGWACIQLEDDAPRALYKYHEQKVHETEQTWASETEEVDSLGGDDE